MGDKNRFKAIEAKRSDDDIDTVEGDNTSQS
jgi:hypothetical protein